MNVHEWFDHPIVPTKKIPTRVQLFEPLIVFHRKGEFLSNHLYHLLNHNHHLIVIGRPSEKVIPRNLSHDAHVK
jgi:hypothetical protein